MKNAVNEPIERKKIKRKVVVDPELQFSLIQWFMYVFISAAALFFIIISTIFLRINYLMKAVDPLFYEKMQSPLEDLQTLSSGVFGIIFLGFVVFVFYGGLHLSRKIAGPIQNIKNNIDRMTSGQVIPPIQFRKHDYFSDLQDKFNELIQYIYKK